MFHHDDGDLLMLRQCNKVYHMISKNDTYKKQCKRDRSIVLLFLLLVLLLY